MLANLKAAGYRPDQIDDVLLTHLHSDHVGGRVHDSKVVFPHALIHVARPDLAFFLAPANQNGVGGYDKSYFQQATAIITPYLKSGQVRPFSGETQILPGIEAIPAPGHTPGSVMYRVESQGQSITFIGDIVKVAAVQFTKPAVSITFDVNQDQARKQRLNQFAALSDKRELVAAPHLSFPGIGHIARDGNGYRFVPVDYVNRDVK
jgi:glyoxylase-like metal-dependent hydrolase (beta-lactamase superfamily II)